MKKVLNHCKKKILACLLFFSLSFVAQAQEVIFMDSTFRQAITANPLIDLNDDGLIQITEAAAFNGTIDLDGLGITELTGIEEFTLVSQLICSNNNLTSINVSSNINLTHFDCRYNQLSSLDVSSNTLLYEFRCSYNQISALDVTNCLDLFLFACGDNQLTALNVSYNTVLEGFFCFNNLLTSIDVSAIPLVQFWCYGNQLTNLDVSSNPNLATLQCSNNLLTNLDLSANLALFELGCNDNPMISLDLSQNVNLGYISVTNMASLTSLNIQNGNNSILTTFAATSNLNLTCVQVDDFAYMNSNWAAAIDATTGYSTNCSCVVNIPDTNFRNALLANVAINTILDGVISCAEASAYNGAINVSNLAITNLTGIEAFTAIDTLICTDNALTSLNVSANTQLIYLCFSSNQLTTIDLSSNTLLIEVCGQFNQLSGIDVSSNTALKYLYLSSNQLSSLDVSTNSALWYLAFSINNIASIDVSNCPELYEITCSNNLLTNLDLSLNTDIYFVYCDNNLISSLDLSLDTSLVILNCNNNQLTNLNLQNGNNIDLTAFNATGNPLLTCVEVDDVSFMNTNWAAAIDGTASYSSTCACAGLPLPQFTISNNNLTSSPAFTLFTNTTANAASYDFLWNFGDGCVVNNNSSTINYTYNTNGIFNVALTLNDAVSGCSITNYDPAIPSQTVECNVPFVNPCSFTPTISPSGAIDACIGSSVDLSLTAGSFPATAIIQWNKNGVPLIGENYNHYIVTTDGFYSVTVFDTDGCPIVSDLAHVQFNQAANTAPDITETGTTGICGTTNLTLTANGNFGTFLWNTGQTSNSINVTQAGVYYVIGVGTVGCNYTSAPYAVSSSVFAAPEICMVDVDSLTNRAVIVWTKPLLSGIMAFGIYKETSLYSNNYQQIAVVLYDSLSEYMDINSNAAIITERYRISIIDSCGGESPYSEPARAMGLKVYPGINSQRVLTWNHYASSTQNISSYLIYSGSSITQLSFLDSVSPGINNNYIDAAPAFGINTVYKIYTVMNSPCVSTRAVRNISQSNGTGNLEIPFVVDSTASIKDIYMQDATDFSIVPNPNNGNFSLTIKSNLPNETYSMQVFDMLGNSIYQKQIEKSNQMKIDLSHLAIGVYNIRFSNGIKQINKRLMITK